MTRPTTIVPLATYRNERPYPFCPGCGHAPILDHLNRALVRLQLDPRRVVLVSDIGCSGLSDQYFATSAFHGLHGRSITYASGIKLARPELEVVVLMGDGGAGIGGNHLLSAARRNIGITVVVFNNFNFGMTGGQHSVTTPAGALTATTPAGNLERPLDLCTTVAANGAGYAWRGTSFDRDLDERLAEAIARPGFALLDVWELCTAYFLPRNRWSRRSLLDALEELGFATGVVHEESRPEFAAALREAAAAEQGRPGLAPRALTPGFRSTLEQRFHLVVAGAAGGKVGSAVRLAAAGAILSGLWAAQRSDYPITVQTGHSLAELILSPSPIEYAGGSRPDAVVLLSEEGRSKVLPMLRRMEPAGRVFSLPGLDAVETRGTVRLLQPPRLTASVGRDQLALAVVAAVVEELALFPVAARRAALRLGPAQRVAAGLAAVGAGLELRATPG